MKILFSDNHIIIAEKPRGLLTQPTPEKEISLEKEVKAWAKNAYGKSGEVFLHVVHRLDQVVSGIVLFAKTSKALERLNALQRQKKFKKIYIAEVQGVIADDKRQLTHFLKHDDHKAIVYNHLEKEALECKLEFEVLLRKKNSTVVKIQLETGRYHQIRAQMKAIGHPIVGDVKYGGKKIDDEGIYLHHAILEFEHPVTKEIIHSVSPPDFFPEFK